jgi:prophage tail gpP-like protein
MPSFIGAEDVVVMIGGRAFIGWQDVSVTQAFDKASGSAKLTITELPNDPFPAHIGDPAVILMAGQPVITGMVYSVDGNHDVPHHAINLTLRDKTQDLIDSTIGPKIENKPPVALADVCRTTIGKMGLPIGVIDKVGPPPFREAEVPVGDIELLGHQYLDSWAQNRQCVLNTDGRGNLVIDRNQGRMGPGRLWKARDRDDPRNNVLKAQYKNTLQDRHNKTAASAQKSPNDKKHWESRPKSDPPAQAKPLSKHWGIANDPEIPQTRRRHFRARSGLDHDSPKKKAGWRSNLAKARGFQYVATVQGFEAAPGTIWWPGVIVPVHDEHFLVSDMLFVTQVVFKKSLKGGATTEVALTYRDAFTEQEGSSGGTGKGSSPGIGTPTQSYGASDGADLED